MKDQKNIAIVALSLVIVLMVGYYAIQNSTKGLSVNISPNTSKADIIMVEEGKDPYCDNLYATLDYARTYKAHPSIIQGIIGAINQFCR